MTTWRCVTCRISKATRAQAQARGRAPMPTHTRTCARMHARTHTEEYIILAAFPRLQGFRECASI